MWQFYILLLVSLVIQHVKIIGFGIEYQKKNQRALLFFFVVMTILVALRHESVGTDTVNYTYYFEHFSQINFSQIGEQSTEWGFILFNKVISLFTQDPQVYFAVCAIFTSSLIYITYKRLNVDASLTVVLFVTMTTFVMMFSGIRQVVAIGIGFLGYEFTRNKKLIPYIITVLVAVTVHTSAFMLIFMYPLYHVKITKKWLYIVIPVLIFIFIFNRQIFSLIDLILRQFAKYDTTITETGAYAMLIMFSAFTVFSFIIPDESLLDNETIGLRNFLLLSVALQMFAPLHTIAMRMNYYYIVFIPLLIPKIIEARRKRWNQIAILGRHIMVVFFLIYFFYNAYTSDNNLRVFPYHFFWENVV